MKKSLPVFLPFLAVISGGICMALRLWLLSTADEKGFLAQNHISAILLWILVALTLTVFWIALHRLTKAPKYVYHFPPSVIGCIGICLGAVAIGFTSAKELMSYSGGLPFFCAAVGMVCVPILVYVAICRLQGKRFSVLFHGAVCVYLILHLIVLYQRSSSDPQLQDYCFQIFAQVSLLLTLYYRASFDADRGNRKFYALFQMMTVFFSLIALPDSGNPVFYLGILLWMLTNPCDLRPLRPKREDPTC